MRWAASAPEASPLCGVFRFLRNCTCRAGDAAIQWRPFDGVGRYEGHAGIAQLVERNLAKVEVESSRLFSRSRLQMQRMHEKSRSDPAFLFSGIGCAFARWCDNAAWFPSPAPSFQAKT